VLTLIVAGFLASLPFTGLEPLWATRSAATVLLFADAALVILINAAWQNGSAPVVRLIRLSARVAALLLVPLTAIAIYALALRVSEHGWTVDRIVAAACMLVASCYAIGYAAAALRKGWLTLLAPVNIATAFVVLGLVLLLFSPLVDPARIAVNSQLARLEAGKVGADKFDLVYLRFEGKRFGQAALARLDATRGKDHALLRERLAAVRKMETPWDMQEQLSTPAAMAANLHALPAGTRLPDSFLRTDWKFMTQDVYTPRCLLTAKARCTAYLLDVNGDGKAEVLVMDDDGPWSMVAQEGEDGQWRALATMTAVHCAGSGNGQASALPRTVAPALPDIELAGTRFQLTAAGSPNRHCGKRRPE